MASADAAGPRIHVSVVYSPRAGEVEEVELELVDGPFSVLDGTWRFVPVPAGAGPAAKACKIEFDLRYSFANGALDALISPVFDRIANTFVDSFVKRAEQVYGKA